MPSDSLPSRLNQFLYDTLGCANAGELQLHERSAATQASEKRDKQTGGRVERSGCIAMAEGT